MSNIKRVDVQGYCPFDFDHTADARDFKPRQQALEYLGHLNLPVMGLRLEFTNNSFHVRSKEGGQYCHYGFTITGEEAVSHRYFEELIKRFEAVGCRFKYFKVMDVQWDDSRIWDHLKIKHDKLFETLERGA